MYQLFTKPEHWQCSSGGPIECLPYDAYRRDEPQSHATWHDADGRLVARCSLWWADTPKINDCRLGVIGHYAASDHNSGVNLLKSACQTLTQEGCDLAIGPMDGNTWRNYRIAIDAASSPAFFLEPNLPICNANHFTDAGFSLVAAYRSAVCDDLSQCDARTVRVQARMNAKNVRFRSFDLTRSTEDLASIHELTLVAYRDSFLFQPISFESFQSRFQPLLERVEPDWIQLAENEGEIVGYVFGAPDFLQPCNGLPMDTAILKTLAVRPGRMWAGLGLLLVQRFHDFARQRGFRRVIHALMHEDNSFSQLLSSRYANSMRRYGLFSRGLP